MCHFVSDGRPTTRSTKMVDADQADIVCKSYQEAASAKAGGRASPQAVRRIVENLSRSVSACAGQTDLTLGQWIARWIGNKQHEVKPQSLRKYKDMTIRVQASIGPEKRLADVSVQDVTVFRNACTLEVSVNTTNSYLAHFRSCLNDAIVAQVLDRNPAKAVKPLKAEASARRAFSVEQIEAMLVAATGTDWEGMILCGLYTGQRLGDLANLAWGQVDVLSGEVRLTAAKTGRQMAIPMAQRLKEHLESVASSDSPQAKVFPGLAGKDSSDLSREFRKLMRRVGLAVDYAKTENGLRQKTELSFHSLRHSTVTMLKAAGASNALAQAIVGHQSEAVSRGYTHISSEDMRPTMAKLPSVGNQSAKK